MRKLLSRIDHQEYTSQLEKLLVESGVVNGEAGLQELRATWYIPMLLCHHATSTGEVSLPGAAIKLSFLLY
jgi:hypothetical protein